MQSLESTMALSFREREIIRTVCGSCRNDLYNRPPLRKRRASPSDKCRLMQYVKYDRSTHRFRCPYRMHAVSDA